MSTLCTHPYTAVCDACCKHGGHIVEHACELCGVSQPCDEPTCSECCTHDERDHGICLDCGDEEDPGAAIDRAMSHYEDR